MARRREKDEPEDIGQALPEAEDTDRRLHGDDSLPGEQLPIGGGDPPEANQDLPDIERPPHATQLPAHPRLRVTAINVPEERIEAFVADLRDKGVDVEVIKEGEGGAFVVGGGEQGVSSGVDGSALAEAQVKAYHNGVEQTLFKYSHEIDQVAYIGNKGTLLAEALEDNNSALTAKLKGLG